MPDRLIDRVLDPRYSSSLGELSTEELQRRIDEASEAEREISGVRRSLHRIIDDLQSELASRS